MKRSFLRYLILILILAQYGCTTQKFMQTELYFGLKQQDGKIIPDSAWNAFVENYATKTFAQGFTILTSQGWWTDEATKQIHEEPSHVIISINKMDHQLSKKIDSLRSVYIILFNQEAVLRTDKKISVNF
ncbi:MAG: DUF3574 domain-containing protein [Parafilimonas sp.]